MADSRKMCHTSGQSAGLLTLHRVPRCCGLQSLTQFDLNGITICCTSWPRFKDGTLLLKDLRSLLPEQLHPMGQQSVLTPKWP